MRVCMRAPLCVRERQCVCECVFYTVKKTLDTASYKKALFFWTSAAPYDYFASFAPECNTC